MRISDWSSDVCSSDLIEALVDTLEQVEVWPVKTNAAFLSRAAADPDFRAGEVDTAFIPSKIDSLVPDATPADAVWNLAAEAMLASDFGGRSDASDPWRALQGFRSEEHTSELQSLMRISYAVFCLNKKKAQQRTHSANTQ